MFFVITSIIMFLQCTFKNLRNESFSYLFVLFVVQRIKQVIRTDSRHPKEMATFIPKATIMAPLKEAICIVDTF